MSKDRHNPRDESLRCPICNVGTLRPAPRKAYRDQFFWLTRPFQCDQCAALILPPPPLPAVLVGLVLGIAALAGVVVWGLVPAGREVLAGEVGLRTLVTAAACGVGLWGFGSIIFASLGGLRQIRERDHHRPRAG